MTKLKLIKINDDGQYMKYRNDSYEVIINKNIVNVNKRYFDSFLPDIFTIENSKDKKIECIKIQTKSYGSCTGIEFITKMIESYKYAINFVEELEELLRKENLLSEEYHR